MSINCQKCGKRLNKKNTRPWVFRKGRGRCIECSSILHAENEHLREGKKRYYKKNKKKIKKRARKWYRENREHSRQYHRDRYANNKSEVLAKLRLPPARHRVLCRALRKERTPKRDLLWKLSFYAELIKDGVCHYCMGPLNSAGMGLDAMDNNLGHVCYNVVPCCRSCNQKKMHDVTYDEMMLLAPVLRHIRESREKRK